MALSRSCVMALAKCCSAELLVFAFPPSRVRLPPRPQARTAPVVAPAFTSSFKTDQRVGIKFAEHPTSEPFCTRIGDLLVRCVHRIQRQSMLHAHRKKTRWQRGWWHATPLPLSLSHLSFSPDDIVLQTQTGAAAAICPASLLVFRRSEIDRQRMSHVVVLYTVSVPRRLAPLRALPT